jgi:hypothetical protein
LNPSVDAIIIKALFGKDDAIVLVVRDEIFARLGFRKASAEPPLVIFEKLASVMIEGQLVHDIGDGD